MEKTEKLCQKQIVDKDEEIEDLNTLVNKFQGKIKEQREQANTLKEDIQKEQATND